MLLFIAGLAVAELLPGLRPIHYLSMYSLSQVKIMEIEQPRHMGAAIAVAGSELLEDVHVSKLDIVVLVDMIVKPEEETVLVKIIIDDLFTEIDMYFIVYYQRQCIRLKSLLT